MGYRLHQPDTDTSAMTAMGRLSAQYPRYGYRRIRIFLRRDGMPVGINRARGLWRQAGLGLPRKRSRRRIAARRPRAQPPRAPNHVWAYDFVFDSWADGQQLKCLTVVDEFTRECLAIDVAGSIRSGRVIHVLTRLMSAHGARAYPALGQRSGVCEPQDPGHFPGMIDSKKRTRVILASTLRR